MQKNNQKPTNTIVLYLKLSLVIIPIFLLASLSGLYFLDSYDGLNSRDRLNARIASLAVRTSLAIEKDFARSGFHKDHHADHEEHEEHASHGDHDGNPADMYDHFSDIMSMMLADQAISCVQLYQQEQSEPVVSVPSALGCQFADADTSVTIPINAQLPHKMTVSVSESELQEARLIFRDFAFYLMAFSMVLALFTSWIGFRVIVGRPLKLLITNLETARDKAEAANVAKTQFIANMSHEIRTPMNGIIGTADLLKNTTTDENQIKLLHIITQSTHQLLSVLNDILTIANLDSGRISLNKKHFDPMQLLQEVTISMANEIDRKGLALSIKPSSNVPAKLIADANNIQQILYKLIDNAIKFTPNGQISITVDYQLSGTQKYLRYIIQDSGIGIDTNQLDIIFAAFSQSDSEDTRNFGGTGLGLTIAKSLADMVQGNITVESIVGVGSTFTLSVPITAEYKGFAKQTNKTTIGVVSNSVLVVDDSEINRLILTKLLPDEYDIVIAENGQVAVEKFLQYQPFLILMDLAMPVMGGQEAIKKIRELEQTHELGNTKILVVTANVTADIEEKCYLAGADDILHKPVTKKQLLEKLQTILQ